MVSGIQPPIGVISRTVGLDHDIVVVRLERVVIGLHAGDFAEVAVDDGAVGACRFEAGGVLGEGEIVVAFEAVANIVLSVGLEHGLRGEHDAQGVVLPGEEVAGVEEGVVVGRYSVFGNTRGYLISRAVIMRSNNHLIEDGGEAGAGGGGAGGRDHHLDAANHPGLPVVVDRQGVARGDAATNLIAGFIVCGVGSVGKVSVVGISPAEAVHAAGQDTVGVAPGIGTVGVGGGYGVAVRVILIVQGIGGEGGLHGVEAGVGGGQAVVAYGADGGQAVVGGIFKPSRIGCVVKPAGVDDKGVGGAAGGEVAHALREERRGGAGGRGVLHGDVDTGLGVDAGVPHVVVPGEGNLHALGNLVVFAVNKVFGLHLPLVRVAADDGEVVHRPAVAVGVASLGRVVVAQAQFDVGFLRGGGREGVAHIGRARTVDLHIDARYVHLHGLPLAVHLVVHEALVVVFGIGLLPCDLDQLGGGGDGDGGEAEEDVEGLVAAEGNIVHGGQHEAVVCVDVGGAHIAPNVTCIQKATKSGIGRAVSVEVGGGVGDALPVGLGGGVAMGVSGLAPDDVGGGEGSGGAVGDAHHVVRREGEQTDGVLCFQYGCR